MSSNATPTAADETIDPRLVTWERNTQWVIVLAAIFPMIGLLGMTDGSVHTGQLIVDLLSWAVFAVDLVVHLVLRRRYLRTVAGIVDLAVVLITFPWYIFAGPGHMRLTSLARVARLVRLFLVAVRGNLNVLFRRLGKTLAFAVMLIFTCALVVQRVEPPEAGFDSLSDSLWWAMVTITTVGYGDLVPTTAPGRWAAVILMIGGIAVLGTITATLASFLRREDTLPSQPGTPLIADLAERVEALRRRLDETTDDGSPPPS